MPVLPSGRKFGISINHILEPGTQWFRCPEGHFWYRTPDLALNAPPYHPEQEILCDVVHAPCPQTIDEMERFVEVIEDVGVNQTVPIGLTLDQSTCPEGWSAEDCAVWNEWRRSPRTLEFLERAMVKCRQQAEANVVLGGPVTFTHVQEEELGGATERARAAEMRGLGAIRNLIELEHEIARLEDATLSQELVERIEAMYGELSELSDEPFSDVLPVWHAMGLALRMLGRLEEADRALTHAARLAPFETIVWLELTRVRGERGDFEGAETAARRSVQLSPERSPPWANLAMTLLQMKRYAESREAVDRALELDPEDYVARYVDDFLLQSGFE
ncbi:MAG: hypothetical protein RIT24_521 [Planctomycetota bacterium]